MMSDLQLDQITDSERAEFLALKARWEGQPLTDTARDKIVREVHAIGFYCHAEDIGWGPSGWGKVLHIKLSGRVSEGSRDDDA